MFFDNLDVAISESPVLETTDYYPFGLTFNSYTKPGTIQQNFKYNSKELVTDLDLGWYDYQARWYDPALGRWYVVDPAADYMRRHSPYNYAFDNPIRYIDPDGMVSEEVVKREVTSTDNTDEIREAVTTTTTTSRVVKRGTKGFAKLLGKSTITGKNGIGDEITVTKATTETVETILDIEYDGEGNVVSTNQSQSTNLTTKTNVTVSDQEGGTAGGYSNTVSQPTELSFSPTISEGFANLVVDAALYRADHGVSITNSNDYAIAIQRQKTGLEKIDAINTAWSVGGLFIKNGAGFPVSMALYGTQKAGERGLKTLQMKGKNSPCNNCTKQY